MSPTYHPSDESLGMCPTYHPSDEQLIEYASGAASEPMGLLIATHMALCPQCRHAVAELESVGGAMFEALEPATIKRDALDWAMARLDEPAPATPKSTPAAVAAAPVRTSATEPPLIPNPLRDWLGGALEDLNWSTYGGVARVDVMTSVPDITTRLMRIRAGTRLPQHTHEGREVTLVLAGGFSDDLGHFLRGDVAVADPTVNHQPVADDDEDCLCLAVTDAPLRLTGPLGRFFNPFVRI